MRPWPRCYPTRTPSCTYLASRSQAVTLSIAHGENGRGMAGVPSWPPMAARCAFLLAGRPTAPPQEGADRAGAAVPARALAWRLCGMPHQRRKSVHMAAVTVRASWVEPADRYPLHTVMQQVRAIAGVTD